MGESYVYAFVRKDLPIADQLVQACHACLEAGHAFYRPGTGTQDGSGPSQLGQSGRF